MARKISNKKRALLQLKDNIIGAYRSGGSLSNLAVWFDTTASAIRTLLIEEGIELRSQGPREKPRKTQEEKDEQKQKLRSKNSLYNDKLKKDKARIRDWLIEKYKGVPCMDCGVAFEWCAMDFDHRPGEKKEFKIGANGCRKATPKVKAIVEKEISKCDLVCACCHRVRTQHRKEN